MPTVQLPAAPLTGGVSTQPPANRFATQTTTSDNSLLYINRGLEKRYGGTYVSQINYTGAPNGATTQWVRRDSTTTYFIVINKEAVGNDVIQVFGADGVKKTVTVSSIAETYIKSGVGKATATIVTETIGDTTFILNNTVTTALTGSATTYADLTAIGTLTIPPSGSGDELVGYHMNLTSTDVGYPVGIYEILSTGENGPWYERKKTEAANSSIDASTMPMRLVYDPATDTLDCDVAPWNDRLSGDATVNPGPSFIGSKLISMTLFQDRLWFGGGQFVASSQAGDLYNLWIDDWTTVVDSDPIDITLSSQSVNSAQFLIPFDRTLLVLADGARQWELQALSAFTPAETNLVDTTNYQVSNLAFPVKIANQLYFLSDQGRYTYMWEYFPNFDRDSNIGENVSQHVEGYIPDGVSKMSASENNNLVFCWSPEEDNVLYLYTTAWRVTNKVQSSWSRWVFDSDTSIFSFEAINNTLYVVHKDDSENLWLETIPITPPDPTSDGSITDSVLYGISTESGEVLTTESEIELVLDQGESSGIGFHAMMDRKYVATGTYSSTSKKTTFTLPFADANIDSVVLADQWGDRKGQVVSSITSVYNGTTLVRVSGDYSTYPCVLGKSYSHTVQLSPPFVKNENDIVVQGNLHIRNLDILFEDAVTFDVIVTPRGREPKTRRFLSSRYGSAVFGASALQSYGKFTVLVRGDATDTTIVLKNDSVFPCTFTNLEFLGGFVRSRTNPAKR